MEKKEAFQAELIKDGYVWLDALSDRNLTVHTYDEKIANTILNDISKKYFPALKDFYDKMKDLKCEA